MVEIPCMFSRQVNFIYFMTNKSQSEFVPFLLEGPYLYHSIPLRQELYSQCFDELIRQAGAGRAGSCLD
jgi:hypothetical protein